MIFINQTTEPLTAEYIVQKSLSANDNQVVLLAETEWECNFGGKDTVKVLKEANIDLYVVHGSSRDSYYENLYQSIDFDINKVSFWGTFWLNWSEFQLKHIIKHWDYEPPKEFKYPFICLNNRAHVHRCATVEELAKTNLIDAGVVTWHNFLAENPNYPFNFFDRNKTRTLGDEFSVKKDSFIIAQEFHDSFLHLITEATTEVQFISEKTALPILLKKPFVVVAKHGYHKLLTDLGFQLYDEIIDYSFDNEPDLNKRVEMLIAQLPNIIHNNYEQLYSRLRPKIIHNYNRALEIIRSSDFIPEIIRKLHATTKTTDRIEIFIEQTKDIKILPVWDSQNGDVILEDLKKNKNNFSEVIIDSLNEIDFPYPTQLFQEYLPICKNEGIKVSAISLNHAPGVDSNFVKPFMINNVSVYKYPLFWLLRTFMAMSNSPNHESNRERGLDIYNNNVCMDVDNFDHLYISLNNIAKHHRCLMMDLLAKYELINDGAIAWRDICRHLDSVRHLIPDGVTDSEYDGYPYKYWKPKVMLLDQDKTTLFNQEVLPLQYKLSFMQLVPETDELNFLFSEKTAVPLLFNKPFLVAACVNYHKILESYGFKLYDEIFDYSFDSINSIEDRYNGIAMNIANLRDKNLFLLRESIKDKLIYNRQLALSYVFDNWPDFIHKILDRLRIRNITQLSIVDFDILRKRKHEIYNHEKV